jgi:hypothetical protein
MRALHDYTAAMLSREGDGAATYECKNTRAYAGVDEKCTSENPICAFIEAMYCE